MNDKDKDKQLLRQHDLYSDAAEFERRRGNIAGAKIAEALALKRLLAVGKGR